MENVYKICFYGGLILAILLLIASIVLFVVLKIPRVIGDLTGSTAKKAMKEMKDGTAKTGSMSKKEQEKYYNMGTGKITVKESKSSTEQRIQTGNDSTELLGDGNADEKEFEETDILRPGVNDYEAKAVEDETEVLGAQENDSTDVLTADDEGSQVGDDGETDVLASDDEQVGDDGETDVLASEDEQVGDDGETDVLTSEDEQVGDDGETDVLTSEDEQVGDDGETDVLTSDDETEDVEDEQVGDDGETDVLTAEDDMFEDDEMDATDVLHADTDDEDEEDATSILCEDDDEDGTSVLTSNTSKLARKVKVIYNIVEVHSDESL